MDQLLQGLEIKSSLAVLPAFPEAETRRVERGAHIVTVIPTSMAVVLQMPRGNIETISPRTLVMQVVQNDVAS